MSQKNAKLIIELYGQPGVGKSTLGRTLASEHGFTHIAGTLATKRDYFVLTVRYPLAVLGWFSLILANFFKTGRLAQLRYNTSLLFAALKNQRLALNSPASKVVIDEALVQRFLSYSDVTFSPGVVRLLLRLSPLGHIMIHVNDRVAKEDRYRKGGQRASYGEAYLAAWSANVTHNLTVIDAVLEKGRRPHFRTEETSVDAIVQKITPSEMHETKSRF